MGRSTAPAGFYTAAQAIKRLGMPRSTFYDMVERGQIKKITPPNKTDGFYPKEDVDKMAKAHELFMLQFATDNSKLEVAQEEDIEGIADLGAELFGGSRASRYNLRSSQYNANPEVFHVLKQGGTVVGYLGIFPLKHEAIEKIMSGMAESRFRTEVLNPENIMHFKPRESDEVFLIIGAKQGLKKSKAYGLRLILGGVNFLETLARRGVVIKRLYATSRTNEGLGLIKDMRFRQITPENE